MNPRVIAVKPMADYRLMLTFTNDEVKIFDVKPYLAKGIFKELQNKQVFHAVQPFLGSIQWPNGQDFCPDTLYLDSVPADEPQTVVGDERLVHTNKSILPLESR